MDVKLQDFEDPRYKATKEYGLERAKIIWSTYQGYGGFFGHNARHAYQDLIEVAQGRSSVENLRRLFRFTNSTLEKQGFTYIDLQVLNLATKFVNLVKGKLNKIDYDINITPIDPVSLDEKKQYESRAKSYLTLKGWLNTIGADTQQLFSDLQVDSLPDEPDALAIDMQINYKQKQAIEDELELKKIHEGNNWDQIRSELAFDLTVLGIAVVRAFRSKGGYEREERIDPAVFVCSHPDSESFDNIQFAGHIAYLSASEFAREASGEYSFTEIEEILAQHATTTAWGQYVNNYGGSFNFTSDDNLPRIPVLRFQYLTLNTEKYVIKKNAKGNNDIEQKRYNFIPEEKERKLYESGQKELVTNEYMAKYGGSWIIGSEICFGYGLQESPREYDNYCDTKLDYIVHAPNMQGERTVSLVSQIIEPLFMVNVAWNKIKDTLAKGYLGILEIDFGKVAEIEMAKGGEAWSPKETMDLMFQNQILATTGKTDKFGNDNGAIKFIQTGVSLADYFETIKMSIEQIRNITGINENSDGSTPKTNTLNGVMEMANESTNTVLDYLYHAYHQIYIKASKALLLFHHTKKEDSIPLYDFIIGLDKRPSEEELNVFRQEMQRNVAIPLKEGGLTSADVIDVYHASRSNLKLAEQLLAARVRRNQKLAAKQEQDSIKFQMEQSQAAAQEAAALEAQRIKMDMESKLVLMREQNRLDIQLQLVKNSGAIQVKEKDNQGKIDVAKQSGLDGIIKEGQRSQTEINRTSLKNEADLQGKIIANEGKNKE